MVRTASSRSSIGRRALLVLLPVAVGAVLVAGSRLGKWLGTDRGEREAVARGQELLKQGKTRQALAAISGLREEGPWEPDLLAVKGLALSALGQIEPSRQA